MPEIRFFEPYQLNADRSYRSPNPPKSHMLGEYQFDLTKTETVNNLIGGTMRFIGYEFVYTNDVISQEETDRLFHEYLVETGQS